MQLPRKPKKSAIGCSSLARPRQSRPCLSPSTTSSLVTKRRRKRATPRQRQMPAPRSKRATHKNQRHRQLLRRLLVHLMRRNAGSEKRMLGETGRRFKDEQCAFLPGKKGSKNPNRDQVWSLRGQFVPPMKNNPRPPQRVLRKTRHFRKAFRLRSNLACLTGTLSASRAVRLGGWSMAFGDRFLQARFS